MNVGEKINIEELKKGRDLDCAEIMNFLQAHKQRFWCWGAHKFIKMTNSALRFNVSGLIHTGHVYIFINGADYFDIYLTSNQGTIKAVFNDIDIESLFSVIDENIEIKRRG